MGELRKLASRLAACCLANNVPDNLRAGASFHSGVQAALRQRLQGFLLRHAQLFGRTGRQEPTNWWEHLQLQYFMLRVRVTL